LNIIKAFVVQCTAHWTEGNTNYLIGKMFDNENKNQTSSYRCLAYSEVTTNEKYQNNPAESDSSFIDLSTRGLNEHTDKATLQIHVSQNEFCRNIDNVIDEQFSFSFKKVFGSDNLVAPPSQYQSSSAKSQLRRYKPHVTCKFPRWLNKKWRDLKKNKLFMLDTRLNSMLIMDEKNSLIINKYTCERMRSKRKSSVQAIVKSLHGCSIGFQCLTITKKSDFVLELKFGKINYESVDIDCNAEDYIIKEFIYVDTTYGVTCPLKQGLYEKIDTKTNSIHRALLLNDDSKYKYFNKERNQDPRSKEPCKYLTQTQTLQVGCRSDQQYSLQTKLCYPNQEPKQLDLYSASSIQNAQYTQIESEINLVCLAHWKQGGKQIVVSKTMSDEVLCSVSDGVN
jgi:hypothetical protein